MNYVDDELVAGAVATKTYRRASWQRWVAIAAVFALFLGGGLFMFTLFGGQASAVIALDVNPSLEIEVDDDGEVVRVNALNEDASAVLDGMKLKGVDVDVAVNAIIGSMLQKGYISADKNSVLISVNAKDAALADRLEARVKADVDAGLKEGSVNGVIITQVYGDDDEIEDFAERYGISEAKATLIKRIVDAGITNGEGVPYTKEQLVSLKVHDLKLMCESKGITIGGTKSEGVVSAGELIGRERALEIALERAALTAGDVRGLEIELDYERGVLVYEVGFEKENKEYEYEINAKTGEILFEEIDIDD